MRRTPALVAALFWAASIGGCSAPTLDRVGAIRCATDRGPGCPPGYSCRYNRCCPSNTDAGACPVSIDDDGSVRCGAGQFCPGGLTCRFDRCCPATPTATGPCSLQRIGAPCENDASCGAELECSTSANEGAPRLPGGYCSNRQACNPMDPNSCGPLGLCLGQSCFARCTIAAGVNFGGCRDDAMGRFYTCQPISADPTSTDGICLPDCRTMGGPAAVCPASFTCDESNGFCTPVVTCTNLNQCPNVSYECASNRCVQRYIPCASDAACTDGRSNPPRAVCQPHPNWTGMNGGVCVLNTGGRSCTGITCANSLEQNGVRYRFPCLEGVCVITFERL